jgi:hypothetical protein
VSERRGVWLANGKFWNRPAPAQRLAMTNAVVLSGLRQADEQMH